MPRVNRVIEEKPLASGVIEEKPLVDFIDDDTKTQSYSISIAAGQPIGLLLALTYPTAGTTIQWSEVG